MSARYQLRLNKFLDKKYAETLGKKIALLQKSAYKFGENILQINIYGHITEE